MNDWKSALNIEYNVVVKWHAHFRIQITHTQFRAWNVFFYILLYIGPNNDDPTWAYQIGRTRDQLNLDFSVNGFVSINSLLDTNMNHNIFADVSVSITFIVVCVLYAIIWLFCSRKFRKKFRWSKRSNRYFYQAVCRFFTNILSVYFIKMCHED